MTTLTWHLVLNLLVDKLINGKLHSGTIEVNRILRS